MDNKTPNNIDYLLRRKGMTVTALAKAVGHTRQYMSELKNGSERSQLNWNMMVKLAKALDCRPEDIISSQPPPFGEIVAFPANEQKFDDNIPIDVAARLSILTVAAENGIKLNAEQIDRLTEELRQEIQLLRDQGHDEKPTPLAARFILKQHKLL